METEDDEGTEVEKANAELREAMLHFSQQPEKTDRTPMAMMLMATGKKVLVPVRRYEVETEMAPKFDTLFRSGDRLELYVYTSVFNIPISCEAPDVCFYPISTLITDIFEDGSVRALRIDPGTPHGLLVYFRDGKISIYSEKRVNAHMK